MLPSPTDLTYFLEIAAQGNLTRAARRLGVAQPSLSLAMQRLEHSVGTPLIVRTRQGAKLTKAGEHLVVHARDLLNRWEGVKQEAVRAMNDVRGRFVLGCHASVAGYSLPLFLPDLLAKYPHLEIGLTHDLSRNITQKVLHLEIDLGIVVNPLRHPDLVMKPLAQDLVTLFQARGTKNHDVLIFEPSLQQSQHILSKLKRAGFEFTRTIESSSLEVIAHLAEAGTGRAILPTRVAEQHHLQAVKESPSYHDEIFLIYRMEHKGTRAMEALSQSIQEGFKASRR